MMFILTNLVQAIILKSFTTYESEECVYMIALLQTLQ